MKIITKNFEELAKRKHYRNGEALFTKIDGGVAGYHLSKKGYQVSYEIVKNLYNLVGEEELAKVVDWEGETINGFKRKFIPIGNRLY